MDQKLYSSPLHKVERLLCNILPRFLTRSIGFFLGLLIKRTSYSQYGEDLIVFNYFRKKGLSAGTYLDIGAFHPVWISNTHLFHKLGWTGVAVDLDNYKIKAFDFLRGKKVKGIVAAITDDKISSSQKWPVFKFRRFWSEIDSLSEETARETERISGYKFDKDTVSTITINEIFNLSGPINFLNIDVEGIDEQILISVDFSKYRPDVIVFEDNQNWGGSAKIKSLLTSQGYTHLFTSTGSVGYCLPI